MISHFPPLLRVKEIFYTIQGEGINAGRPAVFCRFSGCNLWSGHDEDRPKAVCQFCDTDFVGGDAYPDPARLAMSIRDRWPGIGRPFCVLTGGEPTLQVSDALILELHALGVEVAIETNGTRPVPDRIDWITVSPKYGSKIVQRRGHELKVVWPQPWHLDGFRDWDFQHFLLSPMDGYAGATHAAVEECKRNPKWRLSLQYHKVIGVR